MIVNYVRYENIRSPPQRLTIPEGRALLAHYDHPTAQPSERTADQSGYLSGPVDPSLSAADKPAAEDIFTPPRVVLYREQLAMYNRAADSQRQLQAAHDAALVHHQAQIDTFSPASNYHSQHSGLYRAGVALECETKKLLHRDRQLLRTQNKLAREHSALVELGYLPGDENDASMLPGVTRASVADSYSYARASALNNDSYPSASTLNNDSYPSANAAAAPVASGLITSLSRAHECTICLDAIIDAAVVPCGHFSFCYGCIAAHRNSELATCPKCRGPITDIMRIYPE